MRISGPHFAVELIGYLLKLYCFGCVAAECPPVRSTRGIRGVRGSGVSGGGRGQGKRIW